MTLFCALGKAEEVDGIVYRRPRPFGQDLWVRELFEFIDDHEGDVCANEEESGGCAGCDCLHPCCFNGTMRWKPGLPIVRFTSEGLESTVE